MRTRRAEMVCAIAALFLAAFVSACGGKTLPGDAAPGEDSGIGPGDSGQACVTVEVGPSDLSCATDQDCTLIPSGTICEGQCSCGNTPVNNVGAAREQSETASLSLASCFCGFPGYLRCLVGQCTLVEPGLCGAVSCDDGGSDLIVPVDDGGTFPIDGGGFDTGLVDTGFAMEDAGTCVYVDVSTYDHSCVQSSDCILIPTGDICSGGCACGGQPVNASEQSRYDQATSNIMFGACACPAEFAPECVNNVCFPAIPPPP